jgi:protein-tyrosine phosphatase
MGQHIVFVCTGNAARSVMAGAMFRELAPAWTVTTAGTHVIEGQPMSWRTKEAMSRLGFSADGHRSHQVSDADLLGADLVVAFEIWHVAHMRKVNPEAAARTATLRRWVRDLPATTGSLAERIGALDLATVELEAWEDVDDPGGGDIEVVASCAVQVLELTTARATILTDRAWAPDGSELGHQEVLGLDVGQDGLDLAGVEPHPGQ